LNVSGKISGTYLVLKIIFISVLFILIGALMLTCFYDYSEFTSFIVRLFNSEDKLAQFRSTFLTPQKFILLRIFLLIMALLFAGLVFFVKKTLIDFLIDETRDDFKQVLQNVMNEIRKLTSTEKAIALFVLFLIAVIRIYYFFKFPVFVDEAFSYVHFVSKGFLISAFYYPGPNNHIFYSELCVVTDLIFNDPAWVMRMPSILAGLALSAFVFLILKKHVDFQIAILSVIVFSLAEQINFYSTQGRGYILLTLFVFLAAYSLIQVLFQQRKFYLFLFAISSVLGFYTLSVFLYPFVCMFLWSLFVAWRSRDRFMLIKVTGIYLLISILVLILYLPVLLLNPSGVIFGNAWVASQDDFYSRFPGYLIRLNDFWWGGRLSLLLSLAALTGLIWMSLKQVSKWVLASIVLLLIVPLMMIVLQKVLPFERVWLYYLPVLSLGLSYLIIEIPRLLVPQIKWQSFVGYSIIFSALVLCVYFNYSRVEGKTFAYYRDCDAFIARVDSMNIRTIEVHEPEYNALIRFHALEKKNQLNVISGKEEAIRPDLLVISKDQEVPDSAYVLFFQNSVAKAYRPVK
jgi:hypothetical protein